MRCSPVFLRYILMVGTPLGVLLGMLDLGRGINGARPIAGEWRVMQMHAPGQHPCQVERVFGASNSMTLSQAGQFLTVTSAPVPMSGQIQSNSVVLSYDASPSALPVVKARLISDGDGLFLDGTVEDGGTGACEAVPFRASYITAPVKAISPGGLH